MGRKTELLALFNVAAADGDAASGNLWKRRRAKTSAGNPPLRQRLRGRELCVLRFVTARDGSDGAVRCALDRVLRR
jgi:hypothetical protein